MPNHLLIISSSQFHSSSYLERSTVQFNMKIIFVILLTLVVFATSGATSKGKLPPVKLPPAEECSFCSNGIGDNFDCVCSNSLKVGRKYACGPACDAFGYCCESVGKCPSCTGPQNPTADGECTCDAPASRIFRKYACGPACDAVGYCCDSSVVQTTKKLKCMPVA